MPQVLGNNAFIHIFPSGAASANLSGDANSVALRWDRNNPDVTTFTGAETALTTERIAGARDYTLDFAGIYNTGAASVQGIIEVEMAASTATLFLYAPASVTACPTYSGCGLLSNLTITTPLGGPAAISFTIQAATGSLTRGTAA